MTTYRKKPIEIEAIQFTGDNVAQIWEAFGADGIYGPTETNPDHLILTTTHGDPAPARAGDWIVPDSKPGTFYPIKPDVFEATYELATDPTAAPQPATPGEDGMRRERAILRWAAERLNDLMGAGTDVGALLRRWADELDAAPAADPGPDAAPQLYAVLPIDSDAICADPAAAVELAVELTAEEAPSYRAYRLVPLSTTPPAGTEGERDA